MSISDAIKNLRHLFAENLPGRIHAIRQQFETIDLTDWKIAEAEALHQALHKLTGSAGTYGMNSISDVARLLEQRFKTFIAENRIPDRATWDELATQMTRLEKICQITLESKAPSLKPPQAIKVDSKRSPLIHIVEDDKDQALLLGNALEENGYRYVVFDSLADYRAKRDAGERPAAILMDMIFPGSDIGGAELIAECKSESNASPPVIFVSVRDDITARLTAYRAGAARYLTKPVDLQRLGLLLDEITGRVPPDPYRIMLVDDDEDLLQYHATVLRGAGMEVLALSEPLLSLDRLRSFNPDVLLLDVYMPDISGPELAAIMREQAEYANLPILFLSAETDINRQMLALNLGGDDFLVKPVNQSHLIAAVTARARRNRQHEDLTLRLKKALYEHQREHLALEQHAFVSITDAAGNITYANDKFCEISGYDRKELIGRNHRIVKSNFHTPEFYRELWQTISKGGIWKGEICNRRKDGSLYWVMATITPFLDGNGIPYQYVAIRTDITERMENEARLQASEARLRDLLEFSPIAVRIKHIDSKQLVFANHAYAEMFDTSKDDVIGSDPRRFYRNPDDYEQLTERVSAGESVVNHLIELCTVSGESRWTLASYFKIEYEGKPAVLGWFYDVTDLRQAQESAELAKEAAERANQAKSDFLSSMSHELRTPMNAILGFAQLLEFEESLSTDQRDSVREINRAGAHLLELINEVLDLAKIEAGRIDLSLEPVELCPLVQECLALMQPLADKRDITVDHAGIEGAVVRADRLRLKQVLLNLLSNAIKYNRDGGQVKLDVQPKPDKQQLRITVTDTGMGIPEDSLRELFQPFHRLEAEKSGIEGTGIGLTITRRIMEMMGGRIGVDSQVGMGSAFWVDLPVETLPVADLPHGESDSGSAEEAAENTRPRQTILYIEDNPANIKLVSSILGHRKHIRLLTAHTPALGIALASSHKPDLILLDINMPDMDGYEVLRIFKNDDQLKHVPALAVTANAMPKDIERGLAAGFEEYLTKPLNIGHFLSAVDHWLAVSANQTESAT